MGSISYIFGNGMDMQLGLPTRFEDFYNWVENNHPDTKNMFLPFKDNLIGTRIEWSDFEAKFAIVISRFVRVTIDSSLIEKYAHDFNEDYTHVHNRYLNQEEDVNGFLNEEFDVFIDLFQKYIGVINNYLSTKEDYDSKLEDIRRNLNKVNQLPINRPNVINPIHENLVSGISYKRKLNFFTLNYTNIVRDVFNLYSSEFSITSRNNELNIKKGTVAYLHGFLPKPDMDDGIVIGTHSISDFDASVRDIINEFDFCKFEYIKQIFGRKPYKRLTDALDNSHCIICYGVHLGNSDMSLKEVIFKNLAENKENILIYYKHKTLTGARLAKKEYILINDTKNELMNGFSDEIKEAIKDRIFIIPIRDSYNLIDDNNTLLNGGDREKIIGAKSQSTI